MVPDSLFKRLFRLIDTAEDFTFQAAIFLRYDQVDEFRHLDILGSLIVGEEVVLDVLVGCGKEILDGIPGRIDDIVFPVTILARVTLFDIHVVGHAEVGENPSQLIRGVEKDDLFERPIFFRDVFDVVSSGTQKEEIAAIDLMANIAIVDELFASNYITDSVAGEIVRLRAVAIGLNILDDHGLLDRLLGRVKHNDEILNE